MGDRRPSTPGIDGPGKSRNRRRSKSKDRVNNNQQDGNSQRESQNSRRGANSGNSDEGQDRNNPRRNSDQDRGVNQGFQNQQRGGNKPFRGNQNNTNIRGRGSHQSGGNNSTQQSGYHPNMEHGHSFAPARDNMNQMGTSFDPRSGRGYQPNMRPGFPPGGGPHMGSGLFQPPPGGPHMDQQWAPPGMPPNNPGFNNMGQRYPYNFVGPMNEGPRYPMYPPNQQSATRYHAGEGLLPTPPLFGQPPPPSFHNNRGDRGGNHGRNRGGNFGGNQRGNRGMPKNRSDQQHFENQPLTRSSSNMSINSIQSEPGGNRGGRSNRGAYRSNGDRSSGDHRRPQNDKHSTNSMNSFSSVSDVSKSEDGARPKEYADKTRRTNSNRQRGRHSDSGRAHNKEKLNNTLEGKMDTSCYKPDGDRENVPKQRQYEEFANNGNNRAQIERGTNNRTIRGRGINGENGRFGSRRRGGRGPRRGFGYGRGGGYMGIIKKEDDEASQTGSDTGSSFSDVSSVVNDADQHNFVQQRISDFLNRLGGINRRSLRGRGIQNRGHFGFRGVGRFNKRNYDGQRNANSLIGSDNENSSTVGSENGDDRVRRERRLYGPERRKINRGRSRGRGRGKFDPHNRRQESVDRSDSEKEDVEHQNKLDSEDASEDESKKNVNDVESNGKVKRRRHRKRRDKSKQKCADDCGTVENVTDVGFSTFESATESNDAKVINDNHLDALPLQTLQNRRKRYKMKLSEIQKEGANHDEIQNKREQIKAIDDEIQKRRNIDGVEKETQITCEPNVNHDDSETETESEESSSSDTHIPLHRRVKSFRTGKGRMSFNPSAGKKKNKNSNFVAEKNSVSSSVETKINKDSVQKSEHESNAKQLERNKSMEDARRIAKSSEIKIKSDDLKDVLSKLDQLIFSDPKVTSVENPEANRKFKAKQEPMPSNAGKNSNDEENRKPRKEKDDSENKTLSGIRKSPIATEVFSFLVKHMDGFGDPNDLKRESGMFETEFNVEPYFRAQRNFFVTLERDQHVTHVFAFMQNMSYCTNYYRAEGCLKADCNRYHVCKDMVSGNCRFGSRCKHSHNFLDEWNGKITKDLGLTGRFNNKEIKTILSCRQPHVCEDWPLESSCTNEYCSKLHVCPRFIIGKCVETESCSLGHDFWSQHNNPIITAYKMAKWQPNIVRRLVYINRNLTVERKVKECPAVSVPVVKEEPFKLVEEPFDIESYPEEAVATERTLYERDRVPKVCEKAIQNRLLVMDDASSKFLCIEHIHGSCYEGNCTRLHSDEPLPYLWQVNLFGDWVTVPDSESVEQYFCRNISHSDSCILTYAEKPAHCKIEFGQQFTASLSFHLGNQRTDARRLTTVSFKEAGDISDSYVTQWRWYWSDNDGQWKLFEPDSLQHTLEAKYLAKQPTYLYSRENYKWKYMMDFAAMTQRNMDTTVVRELRRRPLFVSYRDVQDNKTPPCLAPPQVIEVELPPSWVPWDVAHPFELVPLSDRDTEFIEVSGNFYKTLSRNRYILEGVFRVQNHALLSAFCNHEKTMLNNQLRLGDRSPVDKRELFHGTDSLDTVRGICINNFDFRLCGKNATVYGQGAYFARDAKYSHSYTKPSPKLERFMFQAKVLVGYFTTGKGEYKRPPGKPGKDHELYDSCVDKVDDPSIFILFEKNAYYPEYLIQYNYTGDKDIPVDVSPPVPVARRSVHASLSSSSISSSAAQTTPLPAAPTTTAPYVSQHAYAASQPFRYPSTSGSPAYSPTGQPPVSVYPTSSTNAGTSSSSGSTRKQSTSPKKDPGCSIQ
ncbi:uncharacterized protein LOC127881993 [Dreissena polymorpha]|uniref:Poly [ADP-ribose] polymerase n=1 Tax=Dreissena polymorpha TaxID=45954 RepID=A0A9D4JVL8_DREPO|nr:uncharacterized protein LOC127881993 [Dreissena polymorpha]KAH3824614.1 hypothetical protein DPMN_126451 [Dreissena polymorpha]